MSLGEKFQRDLLSIAVDLDARLYGKPLRSQSFLTQTAELFWTALGNFLGLALIHVLPAAPANFLCKKFAALESKNENFVFDGTSRQNIEKAKRMHRDSPAKPALLFVTTHPETTPEQAHLLGQMVVQGVNISKALAPSARFRIVQALDDFALDTLSLPVKGIYQGIINQGHIGINRMPGTKPSLVEHLLFPSHYSKTIFRIVNALNKRETVWLALPGGVIHNSRVLYGIREFARDIFRLVPIGQRSEHRRDFEIFMVRLLSKGEKSASVTGIMDRNQENELTEHLKNWGIPQEKISEAVNNLKEELKGLMPFRKRLFRILYSRICRKGVPVLVIPFGHLDKNGQLGVYVRDPYFIQDAKSHIPTRED